jgi:hypothetical protein
VNLFAPPSLDDLIRLLKAWRFWLFGALLGALLGAAVYGIMPPPYRARATVNVDFNLEQAWPEETDREQFFYLERETRKLREIAWSDAVMQSVASADGNVTVAELRNEKLQLSQPGEAGWHFYADDKDAARAQLLASHWAEAFAEGAFTNIAQADGLNALIEIDVTQSADLPVERSLPLSAYLLAGTFGFWFVSALAVLFFGFRKK